MLPNFIWFAVPAPNDVLRAESITAGIFVSIVAWASFQRKVDETPYWRTLKANGELNPKYPGGVDAQSEILGLVAQNHEFKGKQELYLKQKPAALEKLVEIAKIQSTEASNKIEGIVTTSTRLQQLVMEKTTPKNRDEEEIMGYRDVLNTIHENYEYIPIRSSYILQLHRDLY